ncbi:MAG: hypothetical protein RIA65_15960 [Woeseia sp.]
MKEIKVWLAVGWAALLLSSMISMMAVFMGSGSGDLHGLLLFQLAMVPVTVIAITVYTLQARAQSRGGSGLALLWANIPGIMLFAVASAMSMTLIAELSFILISMLTEQPRPWLEHVPSATSACSSVALAAAYGNLQVFDRQR